ncbi:MAG: hypothetical protein JSR73_19845, partial [Proteobacteria bacterium]|nr:hypothetical protein [Pseudomonadota bacterium]
MDLSARPPGGAGPPAAAPPVAPPALARALSALAEELRSLLAAEAHGRGLPPLAGAGEAALGRWVREALAAGA